MRTIHKLLLAAMLAFAQVINLLPLEGGREGASSLHAQEAFYIYQNDGHFNGFFYDEVQSIQYTCTDTLGRTFAFPVAQEIVTADSTYRIMLTAIDSVSFVQPEIRFNPRLKNLVADSLMRYVAQVDSLRLTFTADMPADLRPTVGDIVVGWDYDRLGEGFGGRVRATEDQGGQLVILCDSLQSMEDIFDQFVTVEQYVKEDDAHPMRHRIAGMRRANGLPSDFQIDAMPFSTNFDFHLPFRWNFDEGDATASFNFHFGIGIKAQGTYDIRPALLRCYLKTDLTEVIEHSGSVDADGKLAGPATKPLNGAVAWLAGKLGFPATCPVFQVNVMPEAMLRAEAHWHLKVGYGLQATRLTETIEFSDFEFKTPVVHVKSPYDSYEKDASLILQAEVNGYVQAGIAVPVELMTNRVIEQYIKGSCGVYFYIGPKLSGNLTLDAWAMRRPGWYNLLKESKIDFSLCAVDWEAKASLKYNNPITHVKKQMDIVLFDGGAAFGQRSVWLVPEYENISAAVSPTAKNVVTASVKPKRDVLFDSHIGLGVYDLKDNLVQKWYNENQYYNFLLPYQTAPVSHEFAIEKSGRYRLRPLSRLKRLPSLDIPYVPAEEVEFTIDNSHIDVTPSPIVANNIGGMRQITIDSDLSDFLLISEAGWLTFNTDIYGSKTRGVSFAPLPSGEIERTATLVIVGYNEDRTFSKRIEVPVTQNIVGSNEPALSTDPVRLEFEAAAATKEATLLTNCSDARVAGSDPWIHATVSGGKVRVRVDANPSLDERKGKVTLTGSKDGTAATFELEVLQEGVLALSKHLLEYGPEGGSDDITVRAAGFQVEVVSKDEWATATLDGARLTVVCDENWTVGRREAEIVLSVNVGGTRVEASVAVRQDAWIVCEPSELRNVGAWGTIEDVIIKETKLKNLTIDAVTDWVGIGMTDANTRLTISVEENTGKAREGAATISGYRGSTKYTLRFPVSQRAGGEEQENEPFEFRGDATAAPEGGETSIYYQGSSAGVQVSCNRSWVTNLHFDERNTDEWSYGWLKFNVAPNPDEWNDREATITVSKPMSATETFHEEITLTQTALANAEPRLGGGSAYLSYDPKDPDTVYIFHKYVDDIRIRENDRWLSAQRHGDRELLIDADINREREDRYGTITLIGTNRYGRSVESEVSVRQGEYQGYNVYRLYGGICVGLRAGGEPGPDAQPGAYYSGWSFYPYRRGVYGAGFSSGSFEETITIKPNYACELSVHHTDDNGATTTASFTNISGVINGSFSYQSERTRLSFNVHDMPAGSFGLPAKWNGGNWLDVCYWYGDGGSDIVDGSFGEKGYVSSFTYENYVTERDEEGKIVGGSWRKDSGKYLVGISLFREGSIGGPGAGWPIGHPNAQ